MDQIRVGDTELRVFRLQPGWRWSNDVRPIVGTERCAMRHIGIVLSGEIHFETADGSSVEVGLDDLLSIPPGHDAWVVGGSPCVLLDWAEPNARVRNLFGTAIP